MKPSLLLALLLLAAATARADESPAAVDPAEEAASCLECHSDPDLSITLKSGEEKGLFVDAEALAKTPHAKLGCTGCHADLKGSEGQHAKKRFPTAREFTVEYSRACESCHAKSGAQMKDGVHRAALEKGNAKAATCADCHGAHTAHKPSAGSRAAIAQTCATCHGEVALTFSKSVHGAALLEGNPDVPSCTDCHRSHDIHSTKSGDWKLGQPETCGTCHADAEKMKKYGVSPNVLQTYLADFHGTTASLLKGEKGAKPVVALCSDCHGVHDIAKADDPQSRVIAGNLVKTCQKCHPDANENFPKAWMSHYEPTLEKAPLVWGMGLFYKIFIPFVMLGLFLQIGLHLRKTWGHKK